MILQLVSVSKQKATVWSLPGECAWMWMCVNVQMREFVPAPLCELFKPLSVENSLMASRKLWSLRHGPLPLLQLVPSVSASLFMELMPLMTEACAHVPDLSIYSITLAVYLSCEMTAHILTFIIPCCCSLFFWPRFHTQAGHWALMMDDYSCTQGAHWGVCGTAY